MSNLKVSPYDPESDALFLSTGEKAAIAHSLDPEWWVVLSFAAEDAYADIVSLELLDVSAYLPLGKRDYDQRTDTLLLGRKQQRVPCSRQQRFCGLLGTRPRRP